MPDRDRIKRLLADPREPIHRESLQGGPTKKPGRIQARMPATKRPLLYWILLAVFVAVVCATLVAVITRFA